MTLHEVARAAGVSIATVSRVVNGSGWVSEDLTERVRSAMQQLKYRPNAMARSLKTLRAHAIGFITTDMTNPVFPEVAKGTELVATERGYSLLLVTTHENMLTEANYVDLLRDRRVDGLIITSVLEGSAIVSRLLDEGYPFVLVNRRLVDEDTPYVGVDNASGVQAAIDFLHSLGHMSIAYINGDPRSSVTVERMQGYRNGLAKNNLPFNPELIVEGDYSPASGERAARQLIEAGLTPTAILAANDLMAFGAWSYLTKQGLRVPDDVSLVGFDDISFASLSPIKLTTVRQPMLEMGRWAARLLLDMIEGRPVASRHIILPTELIVRDTCGPPAPHLSHGQSSELPRVR